MRDLRFVARLVCVFTLTGTLAGVLPGCPDAPNLPASDGSPMDAATDGPLGDVRTDVPRMDVPLGDTTGTDAPDTGDDAGPPECAIDTDCAVADMCETAVCTAGRCVRTPVDCGDGDVCTDDICDGLTGTCSNPRSADGTTCATGECCSGACIDVDADPANCGACGTVCGANATCGTGACVCDSGFLDCDAAPGCEVSSDVDPTNCGTCGMTCAAPTPSCLGGGCGSCSTGADCADDGLSCTGPPTCAAGVCAYPAVAGSCLVAGGCVAAGAVSPTDSCLECTPTVSTTSFSPRLPGTACDDGIFCTDADICDSAGACAGVSRSCDDGLACTTDTCNDVLARCDNRARAAQCAIDGACWRSGDANPLNPACQVCNPASGAYAWSALDGAACDDAAFCTVADTCDSAGVCGGLPRACGDTFSCTLDLCDEASRACVNPVDPTACQIGGVCYAAGATNPANVCQICDPARGAGVWSPNDGASCDDASFCTVSDTCDTSAACIGTPRVCDDGLSCTNDACNETTNSCDVIPQADFCAIGGTCYPNGTQNPTNSCEACIASMAAAAWSPRTGQSCDDTMFCTEPDSCSAAGACGGAARTCDDGLACTTDSCDETGNACRNVIAAGQCAIAGACYAAGVRSPTNDCLACDPAVSTTAWTARTGSSCDDGLYCTDGETCTAAGACAGSPRSCNDSLGCTSDSCDEAADACRNVPQVDFCSIGGACYPNGTQNPTNECEACIAGTSAIAWSARTGQSCNDGRYCTTPDTCAADGTCGGAARDCADANGCTLDTCNEATDACDHSTAMGFCTIAATCYAAGARNPANQCQECDPARSTSGWSTATGATCDDGSYCTVGETCNAAGACLGGPRSCDDAEGCTTDSCNEGADRCDNVARTGAACSDGLFCTISDACTAAGVCGGAPNACSDGLGCTADACDEAADACTSTLTSGCLIGGACYAGGTVNAGNGCQICDPARATNGWSANTGSVCNDGLFCTTGDACNASAACIGAPRTCADSLSCTADSCDETGDACVNTIQADTCAIGGTCYPNGSVNPANFCQVCSAAASATAWSPRTGVACDDGLFCTESDACTGAATCTGSARSCSDGRTCTTDTCDEGLNDCINTLNAGSCLISGTCRTNNEINPANQCQACRTASSTSSWSARVGSSCDDGLYCTVGDVCDGAASCAGSLRNCGDAYACTADSCNEAASACANTLMSGFCFIAGGCYASAQIDPGNQCQICAPSSSTAAWTPRTGAACDDGLYCSVSETCTGGSACAGSARDCSDPYSCTTDACNEGTDACVNTLSGGCLIAGACWMSGGVNPGNACLECNPSVSTTTWTARTGVVCTDGLFCTVGDACTAGGTCAGSPRVCGDPLACTADSCNEGTDSCDFVLMAGFCSIGGACYANGTVNPANPCQICTSGVSTTTWSARTGTTCDDGSVAGCGVCNASGSCATASTCSDGAPCTTDTCNDTTGACSFPPATDCIIAGTCYASGATNPVNPCQVCDPAMSGTSWTPRTGARCDDGSATGCGVCSAAAVCTTSTTCNDGLSCTTDSCTDSTGVCGFALMSGFCSIAASCYANTTVNPTQTCQWCDTSVSTTSWSARVGTRCDDLSVAGCGVCNGGGACATGTTCSDTLSCTTNTCTDSSGACTFPPMAGNCAIAGACYSAGTVNPANPCQTCDPAANATAWSARVGVRCNDGAPSGCGVCNGSGTCATSTTCSDGLSCTGDTCDDTTGNCTFPVSAGCLIAGACWADGAVNPMNTCEVCTAASSATAWSARTGVRCTDGSTAGCGTCTAAATCTTGSTCSDGLTCTTDTCDDASGSCSYPVATGCAIAGACYANGAANPTNPCQFCNTATSATSWSANVGAYCDDVTAASCGRCQANGSCAPGPSCDDGRTCTNDSCNDMTSVCTNTVLSNTCLISGTCYLPTSTNPANSCEGCTPTTSTSSWTARVMANCTDGGTNTCGQCDATASCVTNLTCNDGLTCTSDTCNDATHTCPFTVTPGYCGVIGQGCYTNGTVRPGVTCQYCDTSVTVTSWTNRPSGYNCDGAPSDAACYQCDGAGTCANSRNCGDAYSCTTDSCNSGAAAPGTCSNPITAGRCLISSACYFDGDTTNGGCRGCDSAISQTQWQYAATGDECTGSGNDCYACTSSHTCGLVLNCPVNCPGPCYCEMGSCTDI